MLYSPKAQKKERSNTKLHARPGSFTELSRFKTKHQKTETNAFSKAKPIQPKFKAACSPETIVAHPLDPRSNPTLQIDPMTLFLHEIHHEFSSGERIIGLPPGLFRTRSQIQDIPSPSSFTNMIDFLYELWDTMHDELMRDQEKRLQLQPTIYDLTLNRNSLCDFSRKTFLKGLNKAFEDSPPHIRAKWQLIEHSSFPASTILEHPDIDSSDSPFLHIINQSKKQHAHHDISYRFYINIIPEHVHSSALFLINEILLDNNLPHTYLFKVANHDFLGKRKDNLVLYFDSLDELPLLIRRLKDYQSEYPFIFEDEVPTMTQKIARGIGFAHSPIRTYEINEQSVLFSYDSQKLGCFLDHIFSSDSRAVKKFSHSKKIKEILNEMKLKKNNPLLPSGRAEAVSFEKLNKLGYKYFKHIGVRSQELDELNDTTDYTFGPGLIHHSTVTSTLSLRSHLIAQALLDSLLTTRDPNIFICRVWEYFLQGRIDFFNPHKNA